MNLRLHADPGAFGGLPVPSDYRTSRFAVLPVAYDGTSTWQKGADAGPAAVLVASANMELYDIETDSEPWRSGIVTMAPHQGYPSPEAMVADVRATTDRLLRDGKTVVGLGGEHSVTIGMVQAHAARHPGLTVLQFDAHADTRPMYEGSANNHACVMARVAEVCNYVQVGIRSMDAAEKASLDPGRTLFGHQVGEPQAVLEWLLPRLTGPVYVTVDLDVLDPSEMPSTGTPEPGGMRYRQLVEILAGVCRRRQVVGFDVVELMPRPENRAPDFLAARLVYHLMACVIAFDKEKSVAKE